MLLEINRNEQNLLLAALVLLHSESTDSIESAKISALQLKIESLREDIQALPEDFGIGREEISTPDYEGENHE